MIGLSPLSWGHPLRFQPKWVRPSTGSYPRFSLPQDSSPGFASAACDSLAILKARFRCGSFPNLTSPHTATRWLILQKARRHSAKAAPTACGRTVSGTVSLPSRGAFHLSLTVLVRYRSSESIQPWRVVPPASRRISRVRRYSGSASRGGRGFAYGAFTLSRRPVRAVPLPLPFVTAPRAPKPRAVRARNPRVAAPPGCNAYAGLGWVRFRSPLLAQSRLISPPRGT